MKNVWSIILAAGSGTRLTDALGGARKQYMLLDGAPLYWRSAVTFAAMPDVRGLVFVFPPEEVEARRAEVAELDREQQLGLPLLVTGGGERRQDSVRLGLALLPAECEGVLVHDSARPFFSPALAARVIDALREGAVGVVPAVAVKDTVKRVEGSQVVETLVRSELVAVQTPQGFALDVLHKAHAQAETEGWQVTDDASMVERLGAVVVVAGDEGNQKITTPEDLKMVQEARQATPVTGWGYDVHRYGGDRPLKLGGVEIGGEYQVVAHSDGDVLLHALADAILGTCGGGDIGQHFPDTDPAYAGVESGVLVKECQLRAEGAGVEIVAVDLTVIAQVPKISPHREALRKSVARLLGLSVDRVNVKATTEEKLGFTGAKKGIKAVACVSALRILK
ncbi:MAG: 2-C-methyl-D-erythritol 4-phosphate cytidylyltransferase [Proteobacteria bacterium]|nr:2-C-methyl-D-erythritol 4-phosphate cytidylyltransferase [Pseudomonadota bacterium]